MAGTTGHDQVPDTTTAMSATPSTTTPAAGSPGSRSTTTRRAPEVFLRVITAIHSFLPGLVRRRLPVTFIGYAIINGSAFILDISCLWAFYNHLHWYYPVAVTIGYAIAGLYSFLLNRWLNFQAHGHVVDQGSRYTVGLISQYVIFILGLSSLLHWFGVNAELARVVSACCEGVYLYVFIRLWVFHGVPEPAQVPQAHRPVNSSDRF